MQLDFIMKTWDCYKNFDYLNPASLVITYN